MLRHRSLIAVLAVVALALPALVGATTTPEPEEGVGDAGAELLGAELLIDDLDGILGLLGVEAGAIDVGLLEATTFASTRDEPDALATFTPLRVGDDRPQERAAGPGERHSVAAFGHDAGLVDIAIGAGGVAADTAVDGAEAVLDAVAASLDALGATGLNVAAGEVRSEVTGTGASATQDLVVEDLMVGLGDLLPAELLELLPVDVILDLLAELPLADVRASLQGAVGDVEDAIDALNAADLSALDDVDAELVNELLDAYELLDVLEDELAVLQSELTDLESDLAELEAELAELEALDAEAVLAGIVPDVLSSCGTLLALTDVSSCIAGLISDVEAAISTVTSQVQDLEGDIADKLGEIETLEGLVGTLEGDLGDLADLVALLHVLLGDLDAALGDLLDAVDDAIEAITGLALFEAGDLQLEIGAAADSTGGVTTLVCELQGLAVLGQSLGDHSCDGGVLGDDADAAVAGAVAAIGDLLNALPGVSGADGVNLALLPDSFERVETADDGTVSAAAGAVLLELAVPSVTIDPAEMVDELLELDPLSTELVTGIEEIDGLVAEVVGLLADAGLVDELLAGADDLAGELTGLLDDVVGEIEDLLDLPVLDLALSTPSIGLVLDPVSEATFTAASEAAPEEPGSTTPDTTTPDTTTPGTTTPVSAPSPSGPDPDEPTVTTADPGTPELPKTGGGIALLGLLAMLGAVGLRRTG